MIQIQAGTDLPLRLVVEDVRLAVSCICGGIDSANFLGDKALVINTEIRPDRISSLISELEQKNLQVADVDSTRIADISSDTECPISIQVTSFSRHTDGRREVPRVPG